MAILIDNQQNLRGISLKKLQQTARVALNVLGCPDGELSVVIVDDVRIEELNQEYLHRSGPTNVIAFPMREGEFADISPLLLGDVVISVETAESEASAAGLTLQQRLDELLVHGILHLCGFDHEKSEIKAREMEAQSQLILKQIET